MGQLDLEEHEGLEGLELLEEHVELEGLELLEELLDRYEIVELGYHHPHCWNYSHLYYLDCLSQASQSLGGS